MELVFQQNQIRYLREIGCEAFSREETMDTIVPDSLPDIGRIVDSFGNILVQTKECRGGTLCVTGGVQAGVLYVPEEGDGVCEIPMYIPFTVKKELAADCDEGQFLCSITLGGLDARMLNPRKVLVRANLICRFRLLTPGEMTVHTLKEQPECLQMRTRTLPFLLPVDAAEKSFPINEEMELNSTQEAVDRILSLRAWPEIAERKLIGSKAVFKGRLCVHAVYLGIEGRLCPTELQIPFSQYVEMNQELEDFELQIIPMLSGLEVEPDGQMECRRLLLSANLLVQCVAYGRQELTLVDDAYSTKGAFQPEWEKCELTGRLDSQSLQETAQLHEHAEAKSVLDCWIAPELPTMSRNGDALTLRLPLSGNAMYYDSEGALQGKPIRSVWECELQLHPDAAARVHEVALRDFSASADADGIALRCTVTQEVETQAIHELRQLCGGAIGEETDAGERRPSVILRRGMPDESLWSVAKACRTTVDAICAANHLEAEDGIQGRLLLIPMA